jgi:hypothetical protein
MNEYISREAARNALYEADAITMKGVAILNQFPAADVVEVRHGRWLPVDDNMDAFDCSECEAMVSKRMNYCPSCGAKMDGGQDDGN